MNKKKIKAGNVSTEMEHVSIGTTNVEEDSMGISYLQYVPRPLIKQGAYFLMRTRSITCKPKRETKINPRWVPCWVTVVFYKLLLKLKKR